jgi:acetate kinase
MPPASHAGILVLNEGSSSLKLAIVEVRPDRLLPRLRGEVEGIKQAPRLVLKDDAGEIAVTRELPRGGPDHYLGGVLEVARDLLGNHLLAAGHRVVHGGMHHAGPARVTEALLNERDDLSELAPLHQGNNLALIRALSRLDPELPQVACFDTAFHRTMPDETMRFAIPRELHDAGVRRYGAHGLSYEYVALVLPSSIQSWPRDAS